MASSKESRMLELNQTVPVMFTLHCIGFVLREAASPLRRDGHLLLLAQLEVSSFSCIQHRENCGRRWHRLNQIDSALASYQPFFTLSIDLQIQYS
jgi:hypothetical protein